MANLTAVDLYQLARGVGFPPDTAVKMVAIALKESGGDPLAHNTLPPDDSYGLWQINMYGALGPQRLVQFGLAAPSDLFDPATNAAAAYQIWGGNDNNLSIAWAINDGGVNQSRFQQYLPIALQAQAMAGGSSSSSLVAGGITGGGGATPTGSPPFSSGLAARPASRPSFKAPELPTGGGRFLRLRSLVSRFLLVTRLWSFLRDLRRRPPPTS